MAKKKVEKPQRFVSKRQLSQWQRQKRRQHLIYILGIFIIVLAVALVGAGWLITDYLPMHATVLKINDREFNMQYYVHTLIIGGFVKTADYLGYVADTLLTDIQSNELTKQAAFKLGISISDDEIKEKIESSELPKNVL